MPSTSSAHVNTRDNPYLVREEDILRLSAGLQSIFQRRELLRLQCAPGELPKGLLTQISQGTL